MTTVNIQKNVNPNFKVVWQSNKPYNVLKVVRNRAETCLYDD